jgi:uncharacterized protein (DUF1697 family)
VSRWIALLRAVNVGGTGKLPMADLRRLCEEAGFTKVQTYIASGNVVFESPLDETGVKTALDDALHRYAGKPVGVLVRASEEMAQVSRDNPFPDEAPNRTVAIFLEAAPPQDALEQLSGVQDEKVALGRREIYVAYGAGMADSRLKIPAGRNGTARNMNTIAKLAQMSADL